MASIERQLRDLVRSRTERRGRPPRAPRGNGNGHGPSTMSRGLQAVNRPFETFVDLLRFSGSAVKAMPRAVRYRRVIALVVSDITIGVGALVVGAGTFFVIFAMSFFTGTQVGLEGFQGLSQIGAQAFTGLVSSWANTREITPLVAGVALAAQVGTSFTAELGAARISEEIDALEVMAVPSLHYMVATRIWAAIITIIPLYLAALFSSYLSTQLIVTKFFTLSSGTYLHYFHLFLPPIDIFYSLTKAILFAIVVTLIHCYYGYNATGGPAGVGVASGRAIRASIVTVVVLNLFLSLLFWGGHDTVQIAG
jgi:phospholipid/cholesterol/gamma-HCH transport system permease protein